MAKKNPCIPSDLPVRGLDWERLSAFTHKATLELARYDGTLDVILNPAVLLSPLTSNEAVLSSKIEGTHVTLAEVLQHDAGEQYSEAKKGQINEVINYRRALLTAENYLKDRPITLQLIRELHAILMDNVRGGDKTPGQFRKEQNWIGTRGTPMEQARFIPPAPLVMNDHLGYLENFINSDYSDPLVQLAIIHAQFEIIHPFHDGNGRLGRMLIPLFLYQKDVLQRPTFYLSEYLEEEDRAYRDHLLDITDKGDWQGWIEFFLTAIAVQAKKNNEKARSIHDLYERMKPSFRGVTNSQYSQAALDALFKRPIISSTEFMSIAKIPNRVTGNKILKSLEDAELIIVTRQGAGSTPSRYAFPELLSICDAKLNFPKKKKT